MSNQRIGLIFAGQGAQYPGMGADLAEASLAARKIFDQADAQLGRSISDLCFHGSIEDLTDTANCQPAIYTMSLACLALLREQLDSDAFSPTACAGLSLGEFAALQAADAVTFETGLWLLDKRGQFMAEACAASDGAMAAVLNADPALVETACQRNSIDVANYNSPGQVVISGRKELVDKTVSDLREEGVKRIVPLSVAGAFHSRLMQKAEEKFKPLIAQAEIARPACPVVQNFTGAAAEDPASIKTSLQAQVTGSVQWEKCARVMMEKSDLLIELGPGTALSGFIKRIDRKFPVLSGGTAEQLKEAANHIKERK